MYCKTGNRNGKKAKTVTKKRVKFVNRGKKFLIYPLTKHTKKRIINTIRLAGGEIYAAKA